MDAETFMKIVLSLILFVFIMGGIFNVYDIGYQAGKAEACKDVNDIAYFRTATCEVFRDE